MTTPFLLVRAVHILAGGTALVSMWLPLLARKGGALHRRAGWVYVAAAAVIAATGAVSCVRMLTDETPANDARAIFLSYVTVLAAASASLGVRALRTKKRTGPSRALADVALPALLVVMGVALGAFGVATGSPLDVAFAALGTTLGALQLRFWLRPPVSRIAWLLEHMGGMGASCIATLTAFAVVNARTLGLGGSSLVVWLGPGILGGALLAVARRRYERRLTVTNATAVLR